MAVVTSAGGGIGAACATLLAREGAQVALCDAEGSALASTLERIRAEGGEAEGFFHDATSKDGWTQLLDAISKRFGPMQILVNIGGSMSPAPVEHTSLARWRQLVGGHLDPVFLGTQCAIEAMRHSGGGSIVNLSSVEGLVGDPNLSAYNASAAGVRLLGKSAALHCARERLGIRVNTVMPGFIWTPEVREFLQQLTGHPDPGRSAIAQLQPLGFVGEPEDVAYGVLYLASDESRFVTGTELVIDGGFTAR